MNNKEIFDILVKEYNLVSNYLEPTYSAYNLNISKLNIIKWNEKTDELSIAQSIKYIPEIKIFYASEITPYKNITYEEAKNKLNKLLYNYKELVIFNKKIELEKDFSNET